MSKTHLEATYKCWNDCTMAGCPSHVASLDYQSSNDALLLRDGKGAEIGMQTPELEAFMQMVHELAKSRGEIRSVVYKVFGEWVS